MMKKVRSLLLVMVLSMCMLFLAACGSEGKEIVEDVGDIAEDAQKNEAKGESETEVDEDISKEADEDADKIIEESGDNK